MRLYRKPRPSRRQESITLQRGPVYGRRVPSLEVNAFELLMELERSEGFLREMFLMGAISPFFWRLCF